MRAILLSIVVMCTLCRVSNAQVSMRVAFGRFGPSPGDIIWDAGHYYDLQNNKVSGMITYPLYAFLRGKEEKELLFKPDSDSRKKDVKTILLSNIRSLVLSDVRQGEIQIDSFVVHKIADDKISFLLVIIDGSPKLYKWGKTYYFGDNSDSITAVTRQNFMDMMCRVMADKPFAVYKIKNKRFGYGDLDNLVEYYHTGIMLDYY